jgi:hypothetical protein
MRTISHASHENKTKNHKGHEGTRRKSEEALPKTPFFQLSRDLQDRDHGERHQPQRPRRYTKGATEFPEKSLTTFQRTTFKQTAMSNLQEERYASKKEVEPAPLQ